MRYFMGFCCFFLITSCIASDNYTKTIQSWQGRSVKSLMNEWGQPDRQIQYPEGTQLLIYQKESYASRPTSGSPQVGVNVSGGRPVFVTQPPPNQQTIDNQPATIYCTTLFYTNKNGMINKIRTEGYCW